MICLKFQSKAFLLLIKTVQFRLYIWNKNSIVSCSVANGNFCIVFSEFCTQKSELSQRIDFKSNGCFIDLLSLVKVNVDYVAATIDPDEVFIMQRLFNSK